ncbi:uncharacterized protein LOC6575657 [Drosophila mojavensis]|uniref:MADF domain-containing protein n=1 Tax=Drosophila mojavensis TaxID=7230 RepID=B4KGC1_DROMO|nr:uncharacterized protein LOC6575657 [Drosophila mojavensis]EDW11108.1 uncharacterized protein Dmoj_GI16972 [Drosophila mojavensis]
MKLDNFRLIDEVRKRRALWDSTMHYCARKDVGPLQWQEVASQMNLDVAVCKKRFKGLRDSYRTEIRKIQHKRIANSNWPYFRALEFLRNIFDPDKLVAFSPVPFDIDNDFSDFEQNKLDDFVIDVDNDDSFDFDVMGDIFKRDTVDSQIHDSSSDHSMIRRQNIDVPNTCTPMNRSDVETPPRLLSPLLPKAPTAKRAKRRKTSSSTDGAYQNGHTTNRKSTPVLATADSTAKDDPDYNFLISLLPHVKTLSSMNNMKFRTEVSRMLMEMNQQDMESTEHLGASSLPKVNPASAAGGYNHEHDSDTTKYSTGTGSMNGSAFLAHSSMIECDVKIENEPLY